LPRWLNILSQTPAPETNAHVPGGLRPPGLWPWPWAAFALFAGHLLYSAMCALSWKNFLMMDYGAYTNFLYNLAHGDGFRFLLRTQLPENPPLLLLHPPGARSSISGNLRLLLILIQWLFLDGRRGDLVADSSAGATPRRHARRRHPALAWSPTPRLKAS
jgi:hypothetical protein